LATLSTNDASQEPDREAQSEESLVIGVETWRTGTGWADCTKQRAYTDGGVRARPAGLRWRVSLWLRLRSPSSAWQIHCSQSGNKSTMLRARYPKPEFSVSRRASLYHICARPLTRRNCGQQRMFPATRRTGCSSSQRSGQDGRFPSALPRIR
jgi:hypothetical protein